MKTKPSPVSKCGWSYFTVRTDLYLSAKKLGLKGLAMGTISEDTDGIESRYGAEVGFSFDWQKCPK
jgi:hypothetical protein